MSEKQNNFVTLVRNKSVKWPTERGFDEHLWLGAWDKSSGNESADRELYEAGIIFNQILRELRSEISDLYSNPPNIPPTELLKAYCGIANRDRVIIEKPSISKGFDISAFRTSNNAVGNEITLQEVADGCVDAIETAIRATIQRSTQANGNYKGADAFWFMQKEVAISQLYGTYEDYWRALVWGDYRFSKITDNNNAYEIQQAASEFNIAYESSQIRRNKLLAHTIPFISESFVLQILGDKPCLAWVRIGKKKTLVVKSVKDLRDIYQIAYASFAYQTTFLYDNFPKEFLNTDHGGQGFTILELVESFKLLVILSLISQDQFPQDDSVYSFNKATRFCPTISRDELLRGIRQATGFDFDKCTKMLKFLTFNGDRGKDLWCFPIVNLEKNQITYLVASLVSPSLLRVVEHWLAKMNIDLAKKGTTFEEMAKSEINRALIGNTLFQDHNPAISRRIKLGKDGEEEIDLLFRFGSTIIVGELKSIVVTDSAISLYRTKEIIAGAAEQAQRKAVFIAKNLKSAFDSLGWNFDENRDYRVIPIIITSNSICVGYATDGVQLCDIQIVSKYFSDNIVPLISDDKSSHIAWFKTYENIEEAEANIEKYIKFPPQLSLSRDDFEFATCYIPVVSDESPKIAFKRLVKKEANIAELIVRDFKFPLQFSDNFRDVIASYDAII